MSSLLHRFLLSMLLVACSGSSSTRVRLAVDYEEDWGLTELEVDSERMRRRVDPAPELLLFVPDDWAGNLEVVVRGFRGTELIAVGRATLMPVVGEEVRAAVVLSRIACGEWCAPGSLRCEGDGVSECALDAGGCAVWGPSTACEAPTPFCSLGRCAETCVDECADGELRCAGTRESERCGNYDSDPCLEWGDARACSAAETCSGGTCRSGCVDECDLDALGCRDGGVVRCMDRNADGCGEWGPAVPCEEGESCSLGVCTPVGECEDECDEGGCTPDGRFVACGDFDLDPCREQSPGTFCTVGDLCTIGECTPAGCTSTPRVCDDPPAATCVDENTLQVFDTTGTCAEGECTYEVREVACANCPACDACGGVVCDAPPSECYAPVGICADGSCSYEPVDGSCDDGDPCTEDDRCDRGVCTGSALACTAPPAATCADASTLRTFDAAGSCGDEGCIYPPTDQVCPLGCMAGRCLEIDPSNVSGDLLSGALSDVTLPRGDFEIDTDTGAITNTSTSEILRPSGSGIAMGIRFETQTQIPPYRNVGIFAFRSLTIVDGARVTVVGTNALIVLSAETLTVGGVIDAGANGRDAGPGGWPGGAGGRSDTHGDAGEGPGGGLGGRRVHPAFESPDYAGGGGAGHGALGGEGGDWDRARGGAGGELVADSRPTPLGGGSGGGGGAVSSGGGGGGAVQLVSRVAIDVTFSGTIRAPGDGGFNGWTSGGAGGGGSGGAVLLQAPAITVDGVIAANGGGGASADPDGERGRDDDRRADHGGGAGDSPEGLESSSRGGGGGGAAGWVHFMSLAGGTEVTGTVTPAPTESDVPVR
ncbi:MAG: hypothetical protein AAGE52_16595 [Myxococcota bacterium]